MDPYDFNTRAYPRSRCAGDDIRIRRLLPLIGTGRTILDVGCLDGTVAAEFIRLGNTVHGLDAAAPAVEAARRRGVEARVGNLEEPLPYEDGRFDTVFAGEIIEHVFNIDGLMAEIRRVLRPGGRLVATTPNLAALGRRLLLLVNRNPNVEISFTGDAAGHIRYFVRHTLCELLARHGFRLLTLTADVVNFNAAGTLRSAWLARAAPTLGRCLIVEAERG
jgi:2-polyprenyl-3-methyl-5-hydroxy-6-metoxy-1,4-benzoquinol methylase